MTQEVIPGAAPLSAQPEIYLQAINARISQLAQQNQQVNLQMVGMLREMANGMRLLSEQLADVTRQLADQAQRTPLSSQQRTGLMRAIRDRAAHLAAENGWTDSRRINLISAAIRTAIKEHIGRVCSMSIRAMGDVPACQYAVVLELVAMWDEWTLLDKIGREGTDNA